MFEAIILAGGFGQRLKEISGDVPKPMIQVGSEPFLYRLMRALESNGCSRIILSLHFKSDFIIDKIQSDRPVGCQIDYVVDDNPLGTGGAIKNASESISGSKFISINGDTYTDIDYLTMFEGAEEGKVTISAIMVEDASRYGSLDVDIHGNLINFREKKSAGRGLINTGTYVIPTKLIRNFELDEFSIESDFFPRFSDSIKVFKTQGLFIDIGVPKDYWKACEILA